MSPTGDQHEEQRQLQKHKLLRELERQLKKDISQETRIRLEAIRTAFKNDEYGSVEKLIQEQYQSEMSPVCNQHEEQLQPQKEKSLLELESEMKKNISQERRTSLKAMWTALKNDQYESVMKWTHEEYQAYKAANINRKAGSKRRSFAEIYGEKAGGLIESLYSIRTDPNRPKEKYKSKEAIEDRARELVDKFRQLTQSELISSLVEATAKIELLSQEVDELRSVNRYLTDHFEKDLSAREATVRRQKAGKDEKFSDNNQCMQECLDEVLNSGSPQKELSKRVYIKFCRLVNKKYPTPPFVQNIRQSAYEKSQREELQKIDSEALERKEWAPTTLRYFFEKALKIKIADLA